MTSPLVLGQPAPWFHANALNGNPRFAFDTVAGRWVLMLFAGQAGRPEIQQSLALLEQNSALFDDDRACFFGVTVDPADAAEARIAQRVPGIRWFLDYDRAVSTQYGALAEGSQDYMPSWLLLDPMLRVHARCSLGDGPGLFDHLRQLTQMQVTLPAPVLVVPGVLPPDLCRELISRYETNGGEESGFMREVDGVTRVIKDHSHKRRSDHTIADQGLIATLNARLFHVLRPLVQRAFQFEATRVERWIVARYDAGEGGYFRPHRDNTTKGTAHRRFAVTINLDTSTYEGGDLRFPEFGPQAYRAPSGGAVVFSCSLLHEALPVTSGRRYAFLPFLYDDAGARLREQNLEFVQPELRHYRSGLPQTAG